MNNLDYLVFDFETTGLSPTDSEAIQIAGKVYSARTLQPVPLAQGGEFCSMMNPGRPRDYYSEPAVRKALEINKKTAAEILAAPSQQDVWRQFALWVSRFNREKTGFGMPVACGKNIRLFDMKFVQVLNERHCKGKHKKVTFARRMLIDLEDLMFFWFENEPEPEDFKMDTLRPFFGISGHGAHDALVDVRQTGEVIMKFLRLHRSLQTAKRGDGSKSIVFKGSMSEAEV